MSASPALSADQLKTVEDHLNREYLLVRWQTAKVVLGLVLGGSLATVGAAFVGALIAVNTGSASQATRNINGMKDTAKSYLDEIKKTLTSAQGTVRQLNAENVLPIGAVVPYFGNKEDIRKLSHYELCDGTNVVAADSPILGNRKPDLRNRFIKGAEASDLTLADLTTAGPSDHRIRLTVAQLPSHTHDIVDPGHEHAITTESEGTGGNRVENGNKKVGGVANTEMSLTGIQAQSTGGGQPIDIRPGYTEVFFIIKVK